MRLLSCCVCHARQIDYKNLHALHAESLEGLGIGFAGKQVIHPSQIAPVQAGPDAAQLWGEAHVAGPGGSACCCSGGGRCYVTGSSMGPVPPDVPVQEAFSPDPHDVEEAQQLVAAFEQHQQQGTGAFTFRCASRAWPAWWRRCEAGAGALRAHARCTSRAQQSSAAPRCCVVQHTSLQRVCGHISSWFAHLAKRVLPALHLPPVPPVSPVPLMQLPPAARHYCRDKMIDQPTYLQAKNLLKFAGRLGVS